MSSPISASDGRPLVRAKARGLGAPSAFFVRHRRAGTLTRVGENRTCSSPQELPEEGPHHAHRAEAYSLADGRSSSLPPVPGTLMPGAGEVGSHDPYQASPRPAGVSRRSRSESSGAWRHSAFARAPVPHCGETWALSHAPHRARPETAPSRAHARSYTCMEPARPPPARHPAHCELGGACRHLAEIHLGLASPPFPPRPSFHSPPYGFFHPHPDIALR